MKPSTEARGAQRGQVLVITALLITAMIGMLGLGLDGGRLYVERRSMQNGADAAALAAADKYWADISATPALSSATGVSDAFAAAATEFGDQVGRTVTTGAFTPPAGVCTIPAGSTQAASTYSVTYHSAGNVHTLTMSAIPPAIATDPSDICVFNATASDSINAFFGVGTGFTQIPVGVTASAVSGHAQTLPTLLVLNTDCSASASDWKSQGNSTTNIYGAARSNGNIKDTINGTNVAVVGGNVYDHCDAVPSAVSVDGSHRKVGPTGTIPDPLKSWPSATFGPACTAAGGTFTTVGPITHCQLLPSPTDVTAGANVELEPGAYTITDSFGAGCWFATPGIYEWGGTSPSGSFQMQTHSSVISNELMPPGELGAGAVPAGSTNPPPPTQGEAQTPTQPATPYFTWDNSAQTCEGGLKAYTSSCSGGGCTGVAAPAGGKYYFRVTSARKESSGKWRESNLSDTKSTGAITDGCLTVPVSGSNTLIQIGVSNVPGMGNPETAPTTTEYHVYASTTGCGGTFGYVTSINFTGGTFTQNESQLGPGAMGITGCPHLPAPVASGANAGAFPGAVNQSQVDSPKVNCSLGYVGSSKIDGNTLDSGWSPTGSACDILTGTWSGKCAPPELSSPTSDTANEDYCVSSVPGLCSVTPTPSGSPVTPGAALFYFPATTNCIFQTNGAPFVFGGLQLRSMILYAENPGTCGNSATINGGDKSGGTALNDAEYIGQVYFPTGILSVAGGGTPIDGAIVLWQIVLVGDATTNLTGRFPTVQITTPGHLITCTTTPPIATYCPNP